MSRLSSPTIDEPASRSAVLFDSSVLGFKSLPHCRWRFSICAVLWLAAAAVPSARADVVLGNLGPEGTGPLSGQFTQTAPTGIQTTTSRAIAMGFVVTNDPYNRVLSAVTLGLSNHLANPASTSRSVAVYTSINGVPSSTPFAISDSVVVTGTSRNSYTFNFSGLPLLTKGATYWVVPSESSIVRWFRSNPTINPEEFSESGYSYAGALRKNNTNQWVAATFPNYSFSLAIIPVPESSTLTLAGIGLVIGGWAARRSQRRAMSSSKVVSSGEEILGDLA